MFRSLSKLFLAVVCSLAFFATQASEAHAVPLAAGDIAIVGSWGDATPSAKAFAFVTFVTLDAGTVISFTDSGAHPDGTFRASEGFMDYTAPSTIEAGTVIVMMGDTGDFNLSTSGDQIFAYQGSIATGTMGALTGTLLFGVNMDGTMGWEADAGSANSSALPGGIESANVALTERDNYAYTGPTTGTAGFLLAAITNPENWTGDDTTQPPFPTAFTIVTGAANGTSCSDGASCASGFCSDSVCCNVDCGSDPHDCQACAESAGAAADGNCGAASDITVCRAAASACDVAESCNGTDTTCPADTVMVAGTACDDANVCNGAEMCDDVGECLPSAALDCDDGDECTADACDPESGCSSTPIEGCGLDAGVGDAGPTDDAGVTSDMGTTTHDMGAPHSDAGTGDSGVALPTPRSSSCHCDAAGASSSNSYGFALLALTGMAIAMRRRKRA